MLFGTVFGVIIVPGLYYIFGSWSEGKQLIRDEDQNPLSEDLVGHDRPVHKKKNRKFRLVLRSKSKRSSK
jgi:HAE1 family hydrophobic/amphiphilic exporter-1